MSNRKFVGTDVDLATSLYEYGLVWKQYKKNLPKKDIVKGEYLFLFGIKPNDSGIYQDKDFVYLKEDTDIKNEYNWADFKTVSSFIGQDIFTLELPQQILALLSYYGSLELFGSQ